MVNQYTSKQTSNAPKSYNARRNISDIERQKTDIEVQNLRNRLEDMEMKYQQEKEQVMAEKKSKITVNQEH